jgi:hypothetical protein
MNRDYEKAVFVLGVLFFLTQWAWGGEIKKEKEFTPQGNVSYKSVEYDNKIVSELRRVFDQTTIEGLGLFESDNEGLARRTAINLALAEIASQIQTLVRSESVIYNNATVRDVVDNRVQVLIHNYQIDFAGYDPGTHKYRVRTSISGESIRRVIEKQFQ